MTLARLIELLKQQTEFLNSVQYGCMEVFADSLSPGVSFDQESLLDKFANSKPDEVQQVVVKAYNGKKTIFVGLNDYDVIYVYDGREFSLSQFWERDRDPIVSIPVDEIDMVKVKAELLEHFANADKSKLAS